jgi:hypothetical protein
VGGAGQGKGALARRSIAQCLPWTDEIFEKYLQKAIAETNELGDEIARAPARRRFRCSARATRSRTCFPAQARPHASRGARGGRRSTARAGQALLKSLQPAACRPARGVRDELLKSGRRTRRARPVADARAANPSSRS